MLCDYSEEFRQMILDRHRGKESLPAYEDYIADDLGGPDSRVDRFERHLYPEIRFHCGDLHTKRVLDFGCGTGSTTAMLALHCERLVAFDINEHSVAICTRRLEEHGLREKVQVLCARDFAEIAKGVGPFDLILVNAVVEHIPLSIAGLRRKIFVELFDALAPGGSLFINETPNRFWPSICTRQGCGGFPGARQGRHGRTAQR